MNNVLHVHTSRWTVLKSLGACAALACCLAASGAARAQTGGVPAESDLAIRSILLFPINNNAGASAREATPMLDDAIRLRLSAVNRFAITRYRQTLSSVEEGLDDREITADDASGPFGDNDIGQARASHIAQRLDSDAYFVGDVNTYSVDPSTREVTIEVTGSLYYTRSGVVAKAVGAQYTAKPATASEDPDDVKQAAIDNVAGQIASSINSLPLPVKGRGDGIGAHHINTASTLLYTILGGAVLYAVLHHDNSSSSSGGSTTTTSTGGNLPPPPP